MRSKSFDTFPLTFVFLRCYAGLRCRVASGILHRRRRYPMARSVVRILAVALSIVIASLAVVVHADSPKTQASAVTMEWLGWNAWRATSPEGKVLLFNPFVSNP